MNILITGGAGFIGSHLSERLLAEGFSVQCIDDLSTGSISNIEHIKGHPRFSYVIDTIFNEPLAAELVDRADYIFHLAAAVGVKLIVDDPVRTIETNVKGTEIILKNAAKKEKPVLITSTSEVYGKSEKIPFCEEDDIVLGASTKSRWGYGCSKAMDEFLAFAYYRESALPVTVVRLFNTVGTRQTGRYGMVVPTFVRQAMKGEPLTVYGTGEQTRCFCAVSDVVSYLVSLMKNTEAFGHVYNVGNDRETSINELARTVVRVTGSSSAVKHIPYEEAYAEGFEDMHRRVPCIDKIAALCGFRPRATLEDVIAEIASFEAGVQG